MAFNYYPEYYKPIVQQGEITNYQWFGIGGPVYNNKAAAVSAAEASGYYGTYDMRVIKSSWEVAETLPKTP